MKTIDLSQYERKARKIDLSQYERKSLAQPNEDSWPNVIGKSFNNAALGILDLPQMAGQAVEGIGNFTTDKPTSYFSSLTPVSEHVRNLANKAGYSGFDQPKITSTGKKIAGGLASGFGSALGGGVAGTGAKALGAANLGKFLGSPSGVKEANKYALMGAGFGGTGAALEEGGVDPLTANIAPAVFAPLASASGKNLFNKFSSAHKNSKLNQRVASAIRKQVGEEELPTVLSNIDEYLNNRRPLGVDLTTPEVVKNVGVSRLYQSKGANSTKLDKRQKETDAKLLEQLESLGTTGLQESTKGEMIRAPFVERFNKKVDRRRRITEPLYAELEGVQSGIDPVRSRDLLTEEIAVAAPGSKGSFEKYLNGLSRNDINPSDLKRAKQIKDTLQDIDIQYPGLGDNAIEQIKAPLLEELRDISSRTGPRPIQIENTIQELGDKVNSSSKAGEFAVAKKYRNIKNAMAEDLMQNDIGQRHRKEYQRLSAPINDIEQSGLLSNFVKKNRDISKAEGFVVPSEKIPTSIVNANLTDTKALINKAKGNRDELALIKGAYIDSLLETRLSNGNFSYDKANKFINNKFNKEKLEVVFNAKEQRKINRFLDVLDRRNKVITAGKMGGSDTAQKLKIEGDFNNSLSSLSKLAEKGAVKATGTGRIGAALWEAGRSHFKNTNAARYDSVLENALLNPEDFRNLFVKNSPPKTFKNFYNPGPSLVTGANLGYSGQRERQQ